MPTDRRELIAKLREREQDLRAACEYVGGGVKGVIFAEVAENTRDAADALEQAETELSSLREAALRVVAGVESWRGAATPADWRALATLLDPSPADPKGLS